MLVAVIEQNWIQFYMKVFLDLKICLSRVHKSKIEPVLYLKVSEIKNYFIFFEK